VPPKPVNSELKNFWKLGNEELNTQYFDITRGGDLMIKEGNYQYNVVELIKKYGSPLEIVVPSIIESRLKNIIDYFNAYIKLLDYKGKFFYHYPMKVNQNKEYVLPLISEGANLETSSANELWIIKRLWEQEKFNSKIRVLCNGPKTQKYLSLIDELDRKGVIISPVIEEERELEFFKKYPGEVGIRVDLSVKVKSHWDKRFNHFGFPEEELLKIGKIRNLAILHYHISSQIESLDGITAPIKRAMYIYKKLKEKNPQLDTINIGGGAGVPYEKRKMYTTKSLINKVVKTFKSEADKLGIKHPNIICEWGRFAVAPAQVSIFKVISQKEIEGSTQAKAWYMLDGSFINDLKDTWAIKQKWHVTPANNLNDKKLKHVWLSGSSCDSDDIYTNGGHILMPKLEEGYDQYVAVFDTGAYQDSLASHHCLLSSPAKIILHNGAVTVARKRESPEEVGKLFGW